LWWWWILIIIWKTPGLTAICLFCELLCDFMTRRMTTSPKLLMLSRELDSTVTSPESMVERLIAAFETAVNAEDLDEPERSRAEKIWLGLKSGGSKIAIAALGSAGGT
jgi:hypothetical protein